MQVLAGLGSCAPFTTKCVLSTYWMAGIYLPVLLGTQSEDHPFWPGRAAMSANGLRTYVPLVFMLLEILGYTLFSQFFTYLFCGLWSMGTWLSLCFLKPS